VDINQNELSERIITSAMKGVDKAVIVAMDDYFAFDGWSEELAGIVDVYGIEDRCSALPRDPWKFTNATLADYDKLYSRLRNGEIAIDSSVDEMPKTGYPVSIYK